MTAQPYKWICKIITRTDTDNSYSGTGYLVNVPWANTGCILTAGHNLWMKNRSYARRLEITFPGKDTFTVSRDDTEQFFRASPEYVASFAKEYDYGAIVVPGLQSQGFGYSTLMTDDEISYATASVFGYPGDKEPGTMWGSGSKFLPPTTRQLHYDIDTFGGQSGSPVYVWLNGYVSRPMSSRSPAPSDCYVACPISGLLSEYIPTVSMGTNVSTTQLV